MAKVLLSAYACRPGAGSEPGVGWNYAQRVAEHHRVWVLTRADTAPSIEAWRAANPSPNLNFVYHDVPRWVHVLFPGDAGNQIRYHAWQLGLLDTARRLHEQVGFDVAQHVTYVKYWTPSRLAALGVPFVWGTVGGAESAPPAFKAGLGLRGRLVELVRETVRAVAERDPLVRATARGSAMAFATTNETATRLRALGAKRVELLTEAGLNREEIAAMAAPEPPADKPFRFISMGRLLHWKGFHLGLEAFARSRLMKAHYTIVGDGPELPRLRADARRLGIDSRVEFAGRLPREQTLGKLAQSHVLVHPSLHDSGGWVCLEAMASGRPVVCLDLGGPGTQVTDQTGFKVAPRDPDQATADMAIAMQRLHDDPALRRRMADAGQQRVLDFCWDRKISRMNALFAELTSARDAVTQVVPSAALGAA